MLTVQPFDNRLVKVPMRCCYCNNAIGTARYSLKKSVKSGKMARVDRLEIPICENCRKNYKLQLIFRYILRIIGGLVIIFGMVAIIEVFSLPESMKSVAALIFECIFLVLFQKYAIQPVYPVRIDANGNPKFHNKAYQLWYEQLNIDYSNQ